LQRDRCRAIMGRLGTAETPYTSRLSTHARL